ncbi:MAG: sucrose phosphorylase [Crocinitomicaceae bacterium]
MKNKVQLITYVDRFGGGNFSQLHFILKEKFQDCFGGGVHLLPFFSNIDGADAGYDPINHREVDKRLGDWDDVRELTTDFDVVVDLIVNHISDKSMEFLDVEENGKDSKYFDLFLTKDKVFKNGITQEAVEKIYRPRPNSPFSLRRLNNGESHEFWTTFSENQIDIDVESPQGKEYLKSIIELFANAGIKMIRLDAIGYCIKRAETSCFMLEENMTYIEELTKLTHSYGMETLAEIHAHYETQLDIAKRVDYVYDFALPPLILYTIFSKNVVRLKQWLAVSPHNCITVLDTHDGIGVIDVASFQGKAGMLSDGEIEELVETIHRNSNETSKKATGNAASNLDIYQVNCTFYEALGKQDNLYLIARAIQFFCPGIPQVYYGGLLALENDMDLLEKTKVGRDINRSYLDFEDMDRLIEKPIVQQLLHLIKFRNTHPSFNGKFYMMKGEEGHLNMRWKNNSDWSELDIDLDTQKMQIKYSTGANAQEELFSNNNRCVLNGN